jgi:hypothetical protein
VTPPKKPTTTCPAEAARAISDEWGIYDPKQAGVEAVFRRVAAKRTGSAAMAAAVAAAVAYRSTAATK